MMNTSRQGHEIIPENELAALVSSRICHDLINPIGAICNGTELLTTDLGVASAELDLIIESSRSATSRIAYFRMAFGFSGASAEISQSDLRRIVSAMFTLPRFTLNWPTAVAPMSQAEAKALMLLLLCVESSLPWGGEINIGTATIAASGKRTRAPAELWGHLTGVAPAAKLLPAQVHFALAGQQFARLGWSVSTEFHETEMRITYGKG